MCGIRSGRKHRYEHGYEGQDSFHCGIDAKKRGMFEQICFFAAFQGSSREEFANFNRND